MPSSLRDMVFMHNSTKLSRVSASAPHSADVTLNETQNTWKRKYPFSSY
jgi:hypothetical protein